MGEIWREDGVLYSADVRATQHGTRQRVVRAAE
jgi:hypothetical protein